MNREKVDGMRELWKDEGTLPRGTCPLILMSDGTFEAVLVIQLEDGWHPIGVSNRYWYTKEGKPEANAPKGTPRIEKVVGTWDEEYS